MRCVPARIVPLRLIRTEYFVLLTLPAIASFNPIVLVESNRRNLLRLRQRAEVRVLRLDLLHLLRSRLLHRSRSFGLCVLLASCRRNLNCIRPSSRRTSRRFRRRSWAFCTFLLLLSLLLRAG